MINKDSKYINLLSAYYIIKDNYVDVNTIIDNDNKSNHYTTYKIEQIVKYYKKLEHNKIAELLYIMPELNNFDKILAVGNQTYTAEIPHMRSIDEHIMESKAIDINNIDKDKERLKRIVDKIISNIKYRYDNSIYSDNSNKLFNNNNIIQILSFYAKHANKYRYEDNNKNNSKNIVMLLNADRIKQKPFIFENEIAANIMDIFNNL